MALYRGNIPVDAVHRGSTPVDRIYRGAALIWERPATGPVPVVEITPTGYTGPTLTGTLPAASGGYRTLVAADPPVAVAPVSVGPDFYALLAVRSSTGWSGQVYLLGVSQGGLRDWPAVIVLANGWIDDWSAEFEAPVRGHTLLSSGSGMSGTWQIVEVWTDGGDLMMSIDGATPVVAAATQVGWSADTFYLCADAGSGGQAIDLAALRAFDTIPADRAAQRAWAAAQIPS